MTGNPCWQAIPTKLSEAQFEEFVLPHLSRGRRGPAPTLSLHKIFNYILQILYMGCQPFSTTISATFRPDARAPARRGISTERPDHHRDASRSTPMRLPTHTATHSELGVLYRTSLGGR